MNTASIIDFIKTNYPKVVFNPVKLAYKNALGFVVTDNKLILGYITKTGTLCKLVDPLDLNEITNKKMEDVIEKIPVVQGFTEKDKERLLRVFGGSGSGSRVSTITEEEHEAVTKELQKVIEQSNDEIEKYKVLYDSNSQKSLAIQSEQEEKFNIVQKQYMESQERLEKCKQTLIEEKEAITQSIDDYKQEMGTFLKSKDLKIEELESVYNKAVQEREVMMEKLNELIAKEEVGLQQLQQQQSNNSDLLSEYNIKLEDKEKEVQQLKDTINSVTESLDNLKEEFSKSKLKEAVLEGHQSRCTETVLKDKESIISKIRQYNNEWMNWSDKVESNFNTYRKKLLNELSMVDRKLREMMENRDEKERLGKSEYNILKQNIKDIERELKKVISDQLEQLNLRDEQIKMLQSNGSGFMVQEENDTNTENLLEERDAEIARLQEDLQSVRMLLEQNNNTKVEKIIDYDNCYNIIQNFFALNNIFYRKQEIIKKLDEIIYNNIGSFTQLNDTIKQNIKDKFEKVKTEIRNHITFLDLDKYINDPNFQYLKSKSTRNKVSENFCTELTTILDYWNENVKNYREQDIQLTNIYEDLSGAVRVYIRIKPLIGVDQRSKSVTMKEVSNKKQKVVNLTCPIKNINKTFGEFYGVFDETYGNEDLYTGIERTPTEINQPGSLQVNVDGIIESSESVSPGLYNVFRQVQDGYSIVIFGYGNSGSGKSYSLLGTRGVPGIIHYGLANLQGATNIKLKYLFEQYYSAVDVNFGKIRGKIHNLLREIPQMREYSKNENEEFKNSIPNDIDINKLKVGDLYGLTEAIDKYRLEKKRIKATPNNVVSSRSHLFFVFEVTFDTGKVGYVTIVDTAGRESPLDIFHDFLDTSKTTLASIMSPPPVGGVGSVAKHLKTKVYDPENVFNILKEGFYINETINHLVYYFNKKNYKKTKVLLQPDSAEKYLVDRFYVSPMNEESVINKSNNCLTIPIMNFLDTLSNKNKSDIDYKPTKFIMLCNVRQEEKYCDQTVETLNFAQTVSST